MNLILLFSPVSIAWAVLFSTLIQASLNPVGQYQVHELPLVSSLPPSWAGRIAVPDSTNGDQLFFWLFRAEDETNDENFISEPSHLDESSPLICLQSGSMVAL